MIPHRQRTYRTYNLQILDPFSTVGVYDIPMIHPVDCTPARLIGFNEALSFRGNPAHVGVHFYLDDYQFERVWNDPARYVRILARFQCVLTPDFSLCLDMPTPMRIWNHYRKQVIGQFWQRSGLTVIPTTGWAFSDSYRYCFDGLPTGGTISVSTQGVIRNPKYRSLWQQGMKETISRLAPQIILLYGTPLSFDAHGAEVLVYCRLMQSRFSLKQ